MIVSYLHTISSHDASRPMREVQGPLEPLVIGTGWAPAGSPLVYIPLGLQRC